MYFRLLGLFCTGSLVLAVGSFGAPRLFATRALGAESLEIITPLVPAGAVCRVSTQNDAGVHGAEVMLKGGQVGMPELFEVVRLGDASAVPAN